MAFVNNVPPFPNTNSGDDQENRPLLNIINEDDLFYLSSCSVPQTRLESKDLNE